MENKEEKDEILTPEFLKRLLEKHPEYQHNVHFKNLIQNNNINGITVYNFEKMWDFLKKEDIYNVYDEKYINLICKNIVLLYSEVDDDMEDDLEKKQYIERMNQSKNSFYEIIDTGNLKEFDQLINILLGDNKNEKDKIKLILDIAPNYKKYLPLIRDIIKQKELNIKEKYAVLDLLKFNLDYYDSNIFKSDYEEYEREFYPEDEIIKNINSLEDLRRYMDICYETKISRIKKLTENDYFGEAKYMIKNEITKALLNIKYFGKESFDTIGFETSSLKELRDNIKDNNLKEELSKYIFFINLIDSILRIDDLQKLKIIACRILEFKKKNDTIYTIYNNTQNMSKRIKEIYAHEISEKLIDFNQLKENNAEGFIRENSKYTAESKMLYDEDITGRKVDYIELAGIDFVSLVHVLNAYGSGGTLKDFKVPRIIGKEYICLSAIDETRERIAETEESDEEHVSLLFSQITPDQLVSESFDDLYSYGDLNSLSINSLRRENFRVVKKQIELNEDRHTEFILYRDSSNGKSIYPSGILIQNEQPTQAEINAAAYLRVPIVYINFEKYKNKTKKEEERKKYQPTSEEYDTFKESIMELHDSIVRKGKR